MDVDNINFSVIYRPVRPRRKQTLRINTVLKLYLANFLEILK